MQSILHLGLVSLMLAPGASEAADKWALLIGVSDYIHGERMDLKGPTNDVLKMTELLLTKFGYQPESIHTLMDGEATKANITDEMKGWLARSSRPGDTVLIYYSGHGSQIPDRDGDESDGRDEVLCPADVRRGAPGNEITDDELNRMISQIEATDITVILDACHAGTGTRALEFGESAQPMEYRAIDLGYPEPAETQRALSFEASEPDGMDLLGGASAPGGTRSLGGDNRLFTMIASCAPTETSASTIFYEGLTRVWSGVLTYNLVRALEHADGETTYEQLMADVGRDVRKVNSQQTPQIEGAISRPIFSNTSADIRPRSCIRVTRVEGKQVQLRSGTYDEHPGSIYRVLSPRTGETAGRVRITKVRGFSVDGEIIEGEGEIEAPSLAVQEFRVKSEQKLQVRLGEFGDLRIDQAMRHRLERLDFVWVALSDTHYFDVEVKGRIDGSVLSLLSGYDITAWLEEGGMRSREATSTDVDEIMGVLRPLLENAYAIKKLTRMDNDSAPFRVSVWATGSPDPGRVEGKFLEMKVGDPVYFHFRSQKDAYLTLLNVGADGGITILFPNGYIPHNRVVAGKTYTIPTPEMGFELHLGGPPGQELVKAFATEFPLDLSALNAEAVGGFRALDFEGGDSGYGPSAVDGLASAISTSFNANAGAGTRAIMLSAAPKEEAPPAGTPTENWSTDYLIIDAH